MAKIKEYQGIVGANVKRLRLSLPTEYNTIKRFAKYVGVGNGTINRIEKSQTDAQLSSLVKIAAKFDLEPWHLFVKEVDPARKPHLLTHQEMDWHLQIEKLAEERPKSPVRR